jgi:hypothetical protein
MACRGLAESRGRGKEGRDDVRFEIDAWHNGCLGGRRCRRGPGGGLLALSSRPATGRHRLRRRDVALRAAVLLQAVALPPTLCGAALLRQLLPQAASLSATLCGFVLLRYVLSQTAPVPAALRGLVLPGKVLPSPVNRWTKLRLSSHRQTLRG